MEHSAGLNLVDREAAIGILRTRLSGRLRHVLRAGDGTGRRRKSVEWIVAETEHSGGRLRSRLVEDDLAAFLVDLTGPDLLYAYAELRYQLAVAASSDELDRLHEYPSQCRGRGGRQSQARAVADRPWHSGKGWPKHFVRTLGFPMVFAGLAGAESEPDTLEVEPFKPLPMLTDFQDDMRTQVLEVLRGTPGKNRGILTLPTGAGKTRTAVEALTRWRLAAENRPGILWVAQSEELCEQAVQAFREVWIDQGHRDAGVREPLSIHRLWGSHRIVPVSPEVVIASIQKLHAIVRTDHPSTETDERRNDLSLMARELGAVVIDEAHRMLAPSYADVLRFIGVDISPGASSAVPLVGMTATPYRSVDDETRGLVARFGSRLLTPTRLGPDAISTLRGHGVLSRPVHKVIVHGGPRHSIDEEPRFRAYFEQFRDFPPELLQQLGEERTRNQQLLRILRDLPSAWPTLFFACSVEHAKAMAVLLRRHGRTAASVSSETRWATRRFLIEEFRAGRISVLCNYGVLTTGFDAPCVRALVISRPTASPVLYEQMIGRGMRGPRFGGTDECLVIDIADNIQFGGQMAFRRYGEYWTAEASEG